MSIEKSFTVQLSPTANPQDAIDVTFTVTRHGHPSALLGDTTYTIEPCSDIASITFTGSLSGQVTYYVESSTPLGCQNMHNLAEDYLPKIVEMFIPEGGRL